MNKRIGALWLKTTQDGKQYFSGVINDLRGEINIAIFPNDRKESQNHPDYNIVLSEQKKQVQPQTFQPAQTPIKTVPMGEIPVIESGESDIDVKDIPF